jgi:ribosomal RNA-processing protein 7
VEEEVVNVTRVKKRKVDSIAGFCVLPVKLLNSQFYKFIYFKEHKERGNTALPLGKTIFVTNLCADCTKEDLENIFSNFGKVSAVYLDSLKKNKPNQNKEPKPKLGKPTASQMLIMEEKKKRLEASTKEEEEKLPFSVAGYAHVVFEEEEGLANAIKLSCENLDQSEIGSEKKGVKKWKAEHKAEMFVDIEQLQKETNEYMLNYDTKKIQYEKRLEALSSAPDEEGWVTVTRGKKKSTGAVPAIGMASKLDQQTLNKLIEKEKKKHKTDFYRFQRTSQTNSHMQELRKRFEEDKKRIEKLREGRKFRPF